MAHRQQGVIGLYRLGANDNRIDPGTPAVDMAAGLFAADLAVFEARMRGTGEAYGSEARVSEVLELVAQAEALLAAS